MLIARPLYGPSGLDVLGHALSRTGGVVVSKNRSTHSPWLGLFLPHDLIRLGCNGKTQKRGAFCLCSGIPLWPCLGGGSDLHFDEGIFVGGHAGKLGGIEHGRSGFTGLLCPKAKGSKLAKVKS